MSNEYRFTLCINDDEQLTYPIYDDKLAIKYAKGNNQAFFRAELDGVLKFVKSDYQRIKNADFDTIFYVRIQKFISSLNSYSAPFYVGKFTKVNCAVDEDNQIAEVKLTVVDDYTEVLESLEKKQDLIKLAPQIQQIDVMKFPIFQVYTPGEKVVNCYTAGTYWELECEAISDESELAKYGFTSITRVSSVAWSIFPSGALAQQFEYHAGKVTGIEESHDGSYLYNTAGDTYYVVSLNKVPMPQYIYRKTGQTSFEKVYLYPTETTGVYEIGLNTSDYLVLVTRQIVCRVVTDKETEYSLLDKPEFGVFSNYHYATPYSFSEDDLVFVGYSETTTANMGFGIMLPNVGSSNTDLYYDRPSTDEFGALWPISKSQWGLASFWVRYENIATKIATSEFTTFKLKHAYRLEDCITEILRNCGISDITVDSVAPIDNYYLYITPISNILKGDYDQPAMKAEITLKSIFEMLQNCFKYYWYIDNKKLCFKSIEKFSPCEPENSLNLKNAFDSRTKKSWSFGTSRYEYDFENMPERFQFAWADDVTLPFVGYPIEIKSNYVKKGQIEDIRISNFSTDIDYMLAMPEEFNRDNLALIICKDKKLETVPLEYEGTKVYLQNGHLSFLYLTENFYPKELPGSKAIINKKQYTGGIFVKRTKKQEIEYPQGFSIDLNNCVTTELGTGQIEKLEINLSSELAKITILHDTEK